MASPASSAKSDEKTALQTALTRARGGFGIAMALSFLVNLLMLVSPLYMLQAYDRVLTSGSTSTLLYLTIIAAIALLVLGVFEALRTAILTRTAAWSAEAARDSVLSSTFQAKFLHPDSSSQPVRDLKQVQNFLSGQGVTPILDAPWAPGFIVIIWIMHPSLGVLAIISAIILAAIGISNELFTRAAMRDANQRSVASMEALDSALQNAEVIEAMGMRGAAIARWKALDTEASASGELAAERSGFFTGASKFVRLSSQMAVLGLGALLVLQGELTAGGMVAASILLGRALAPLEQLIGAWKSLIATLASYGRVQTLLRTAPEAEKPFDLPEPKANISVRSLYYKPAPDAPPILSNVSFDVKEGECLGVIGASAAGKTTLCRLLTGVYMPTAGEVRLDNAELSFWDRAALGHHMGYLPQSVDLFNATIAENIARLGNPDPEAVVAAAQLAGVHEMILHLTDGYDTRYVQGGRVISAGQRQRIGLARAVYGTPKLIVLDEPNSNLDAAGEAALHKAVVALKKAGRAIVIVAHRRDALANADKLVVLRGGQIAAYGPAADVFRQLDEEVAARRGNPRLVSGGKP
ncbi:MAG: type I secretion system permease/ATPase [Pseudomonadota bacterium]